MDIQELALPAPPVVLQQDQVTYMQVLAAFSICMLLPWRCGAAGASLNPIIGQYSQKNLLHSVLMMAKPSHIGWALPSSSHVNQRTVHHHRPCITTCCASPQAVHHHRPATVLHRRASHAKMLGESCGLRTGLSIMRSTSG